MAFLTSIGSILSIILMIALGFILRQRGWFSDSFAGNVSKLIMNVALPASIFVSVLKYLTRETLFSLSNGLLYSFLAVFLGYVVAYILVAVLKVPVGRKGVFINTVVNANTIFIGLPLNIALFGEKSLPYFLVYYVTNTVSTWAFGALIIANDDPTKKNGSGSKKSFNWRKLLPAPLIGFLVALVFLLLTIPVPAFINSTLTYVGNIVTPLSLIYIGIVLCDAGLKSIHFDRDTIVALLGRFVLAPAVMIALITFCGDIFGNLPTLESQTLIIQSAAPALAVLPILANEAHGDVEYATNIVTTSTILFVIVIPIINSLLGILF
ncbi:AEC family transporter [Vagococcus vulneris]|uniref:Malate permease n=1 Tax=Vagococcus vulneris TaxID=1977869 RepID=A0A429ZWI7_9ENTE|nr:AEC family transporter [Vagococcus vulneris]RST98142.1 malate permease [Vagococcus vulneris]